MTYTEYKRLRSDGKILAGVSNPDALRLVEYLPKRYQYAHLFWSWVWMLSCPWVHLRVDSLQVVDWVAAAIYCYAHDLPSHKEISGTVCS